MKTAGGIAAGLLVWLTAQAFALGLAGGGDGWDGPAALSLTLLPLCPALFVRLLKHGLALRFDATMLLVAAGLDGVLIYNIYVQEPGYLSMARDVAPGLVWSWLLLWAGWQLIVLAVFARSTWQMRFEPSNVR